MIANRSKAPKTGPLIEAAAEDHPTERWVALRKKIHYPLEVAAHLPEARHLMEVCQLAAEELARLVAEGEVHLQAPAEDRLAAEVDPMAKLPDSVTEMERHPDLRDFPSTSRVV